ncbi:aconitate hydratase AcnA [Psychrobacter cryohalolentis]|uniref:Aconitate hydratase n=1 Tax=Psychrobacter cryohalolentis (strain ATCC BAA-1226 / DSM 17306 / VKM B-2378 / K5) TaxID=335284 RepID=Q1Q842_PSYCK|nr:aconitate hydratase AcnA [Psychrobacter cryohalolentis]ABE76161.1 aconitase [Psychrobacter cryohalolentis K5]ASE26340.1 aconitate hydratase AcnA [Psychrobacter cryohalolentis]
MSDIFNVKDTITVDSKDHTYYSLPKLTETYENISKLPFCMKVVLENLLRNEDDGQSVGKNHIEAVANWDAGAEASKEIAFMPARVVLQDFTGVPSVVDLAAMRDAVVELGGKAEQINPFIPSELVVDHSVQVDAYGREDAIDLNEKIEFKRNNERYEFLHWGKNAFKNFVVVPPATGIVHQVNLEYLARVVMAADVDGELTAYPDTVFGTDSHTTMINGIGVLGWGVGGIEAEAAMLGQPSSMLIPQVVGFELKGKLTEGVTATDLVLRVVEMLRAHGVVGKFVEFYGEGLHSMPLADRATIANMSPEYGATCGIFPIDQMAIDYLRLSGRDEAQIELVEKYAKAQGLWHDADTPAATYSSKLELDLSSVQPALAGPNLPQQRINLSDMHEKFGETLTAMTKDRKKEVEAKVRFDEEGGKQEQAKTLAAKPNPFCAEGSTYCTVKIEDEEYRLRDGSVVIAAITSCTNTSNPAVMIGAGLVAKKAAAKGLTAKPWVKTSLAPGSKVVTDYLEKAELMDELEKIGFYLVGYGCTTCIGNSGPLLGAIEGAIEEGDLVAAAVLSGNRNFEGRIHSHVKASYLASPPLVVAYALAGTVDIDLTTHPLGQDQEGNDVFLKDIWPTSEEINELIANNIDADMFRKNYGEVFDGSAAWNAISSADSQLYPWSEESTYIKNPPFFDGMTMEPEGIPDIEGARILGLFGDSITTDHISPAGNIDADSPAGKYLQGRGVMEADFNSYGSRRGNDAVMTRGTFANIRIKNAMMAGKEGGYTYYFNGDSATLQDGQEMAIYDAAMKYKEDKRPLVVLGGAEYGSGSSRDWAAKGTILLGVKAVLTSSFERIHRSNLVGMGVLPLTFKDGENAATYNLDGSEVLSITGLDNGESKTAKVTATRADSSTESFDVNVMLQTPKEREYVRHGGVLHYVLRQLAAESKDAA